MWECQECGQENDDSLPHCMSCGIEREGAPAAAPEPERMPVRPEPRSEWELTRTIARVVSFFGWLMMVVGFFGPTIAIVSTETGRRIGGEVLWVILFQMLGICTAGLFVVLFGHIARAIVDIRESVCS
jgi:hypothetical protein